MTKKRKKGKWENLEKKSRMIHEYMETICTDRKKNHVARRAPWACSALSCEENREKNMSVDRGERLLAAANTPASFCPRAISNNWFRVRIRTSGWEESSMNHLVLVDLPYQQGLRHAFRTLDSRAQYVYLVGPKRHLTVEDLES